MLYQITIFKAVYEEGGFLKASKRLGLTQSAVSQQIKSLESELNVQLFSKENRSEPTAAGDYFYKEGVKLLSAISDIRGTITSLDGNIGGSLTFGMIDVAAISLLPSTIKKFQKKYPDVKMDAQVRPSGELIKMVEEYNLDFAVAVAEEVGTSLLSTQIYSDSIVAVIGKKSPFFRRTNISIKELKGEPLILYPSSSHSRMLIERHFAKAGIVATVAMEMHYPAAILSLVAQGMGVGLISELSADQEKKHGLKKIYIDELKSARKISLIQLKERALTPQAAQLAEMIKSGGLHLSS